MKLIRESTQELQYLTEDANGKKSYFIEGIFMQSDKGNRNGRIYPYAVMEKELDRYQTMIAEKRSLGELGHPDNPSINLNQVSHLITSLRFEGKDVIGRAKILETPMGKIARNFIDEGVRLGVSSRGLGSLKETKDGVMEVQDDFHLATVDIVADPSAPDAFVAGIMEGREWILENGIWTSIQIENAQKVMKQTTAKNLDEAKLKIWEQFMSGLSR
ncbi:MAG: primosomal protein [Actinobacteria bacterium]|jgi:hypothetical protein|nr:primosomal protein [Actinomycetota bacterium]NDD97988.1 primosomal protein [Actinomycetota bacterium]NDE81928.1 primosomal protein [Actinomycetota bacterium]